jgi:hypothetical protein
VAEEYSGGVARDSRYPATAAGGTSPPWRGWSESASLTKFWFLRDSAAYFVVYCLARLVRETAESRAGYSIVRRTGKRKGDGLG